MILKYNGHCIAASLQRFILNTGISALLLLTACVACSQTAVSASVLDTAPETRLQQIFSRIAINEFEAAQADLDDLLLQHPNFRLAHLIKGDLLLARARPLTTFGNLSDAPGDPQLEDLREEAIARLRAYSDPPPDNAMPRYLLQLGPEHQHAIVVDTQRARLYVYRNEKGYPRLEKNFYASHGKAGADKTHEGDNRTPIGVYHVTRFIPGPKLPDFYGKGAFPLNYPNEWDKRQGRTGYGIWLHGTPSDTYARPPKASEGCVVLANEDLIRLHEYIKPGLTPVIISDQLEWLSPEDWQNERNSLRTAVENWRQDWESLEVDRYLGHYSPSFQGEKMNYTEWVAQKRRIARQRDWVKVDLEKMSIMRNPGPDDLFVVTFEQHYRSGAHNSSIRKRQYWVRENRQWKIIFEGTA